MEPTINRNELLNNAASALVINYFNALPHSTSTQDQEESFVHDLLAMYETQTDFFEILKKMDALIEANEKTLAMQEILFDFLILNYMSKKTELEGEDYLDTQEWMAIEDATADRGTEFLNLIVYLSECILDEIEPDLDDYIDEFLLTEDDLDQDEFAIYETVIKNRELVDAPLETLLNIEVEQDEIKDIFLPMMCFFNRVASLEEKQSFLRSSKPKNALNIALFEALQAFVSFGN
jgi:hypothetical protein